MTLFVFFFNGTFISIVLYKYVRILLTILRILRVYITLMTSQGSDTRDSDLHF